MLHVHSMLDICTVQVAWLSPLPAQPPVLEDISQNKFHLR